MLFLWGKGIFCILKKRYEWRLSITKVTAPAECYHVAGEGVARAGVCWNIQYIGWNYHLAFLYRALPLLTRLNSRLLALSTQGATSRTFQALGVILEIKPHVQCDDRPACVCDFALFPMCISSSILEIRCCKKNKTFFNIYYIWIWMKSFPKCKIIKQCFITCYVKVNVKFFYQA